jgi:hypothetical protein
LSAQSKEPFSPDFRYDTIIETLKGLATNELVYDHDAIEREGRVQNEEWRDQIAASMDQVHDGARLFADPKTSQTALEDMEPKLFSSILFLKSLGILRPTVNREEILAGIANLNMKYEALSGIMKEILIILSDVKEIVERLGNR